MLGENKYMTITVIAKPQNDTFYFSGLHQDILIYRAASGEIETFETDGMWLGIMDDISDTLSVQTFELQVDDVIILYTDGITEGRNEHGEMLDTGGLSAVFQAVGDQAPEVIKQRILETASTYRNNDDVTFVIIKRNA